MSGILLQGFWIQIYFYTLGVIREKDALRSWNPNAFVLIRNHKNALCVYSLNVGHFGVASKQKRTAPQCHFHQCFFINKVKVTKNFATGVFISIKDRFCSLKMLASKINIY